MVTAFIDEPVDATPAPAARQELRPSLRDATIFVARLEGLLETEARLDPEEAHLLSNEFQSSRAERSSRIRRTHGPTRRFECHGRLWHSSFVWQ